MIVVDTSIWSLALRRRRKDLSESDKRHSFLLQQLIVEDLCLVLGPIRQELLSGIHDNARFDQLQDYLSGFPDVPCLPDDFYQAAKVRNQCEIGGVACAATDALICAQAIRANAAIYTADADFSRYAKCCDIQLATPDSLRAMLKSR